MKRTLLLFCILVSFSGCSDDTEDVTKTMTVRISHEVSGVPLERNKLKYTNKAGEKYSVINLKYYLSRFSFRQGESMVTFDTIIYIDAFDQSTLQARFEFPVNFEPESLTFTFGIPEEKNVDNALPASQEHLSMIWPPTLGGGYHYMKLEGRYELTAGGLSNHNTHTGRLKMEDYSDSHLFFVDRPLANISSREKLNLVMDINQWYENPQTYSFNYFGKAIMTNPEAQNALRSNGKTVFSLKVDDQ